MGARGTAAGTSASALIADATQRFEAAGLHYGHGTDNAADEALFLVLHALGWGYDVSDAALAAPLVPAQRRAVEAVIAARIATRKPAAYLTGRMWFAGHEFAVDERVLVPRSPIAELIGEGFEPWRGGRPLLRVLDIGTGSGCIAIAIALAFPRARVDATDVSAAALAVARANVARYALEERVTLAQCDLFPAPGTRYDLIVSNPPYVPRAVWEALPPEYHAEPTLALTAGDDGCDCLAGILARAADYLAPGGQLLVEVGEIWPAVAARWPRLPFTWIEFAHGGEGVFLLERDELLDAG
ncbi:MAG: 50S ribosomal protein L3 N(5)-glutamine methyltransferase [Gammaproteobacteria bacterium]